MKQFLKILIMVFCPGLIADDSIAVRCEYEYVSVENIKTHVYVLTDQEPLMSIQDCIKKVERERSNSFEDITFTFYHYTKYTELTVEGIDHGSKGWSFTGTIGKEKGYSLDLEYEKFNNP